jgi:hypothetical protein
VHSHIASLLDGDRLELIELKTRSTLLDTYTGCHLLRSNLEASALRLKILGTNLSILLASVSYPLRADCMVLSRVSFSMLPKITPSFSGRLPL